MLLVILTLSCCLLAYLGLTGIRALLFAVGPPILIAACINVALSPHRMAEARHSRPHRHRQQQLSDDVRMLLSLVLALLLWIPVLLALTLR